MERKDFIDKYLIRRPNGNYELRLIASYEFDPSVICGEPETMKRAIRHGIDTINNHIFCDSEEISSDLRHMKVDI